MFYLLISLATRDCWELALAHSIPVISSLFRTDVTGWLVPRRNEIADHQFGYC